MTPDCIGDCINSIHRIAVPDVSIIQWFSISITYSIMGSKFSPDIVIACVICVVRSSDSNYGGIIMRVSPLRFHSDYKEYHTDTTVRSTSPQQKMEEAEKVGFNKIESSINTSYYGKSRVGNNYSAS